VDRVSDDLNLFGVMNRNVELYSANISDSSQEIFGKNERLSFWALSTVFPLVVPSQNNRVFASF